MGAMAGRPPAPPAESLRRKTCRRCHTPFVVCRACDRGRAYCSPACRDEAYVVAHRRHSAASQDKVRGRRAHQLRQDRYRKAHRKNVTDTHGDAPNPRASLLTATPLVAPKDGAQRGGRGSDGVHERDPAEVHACPTWESGPEGAPARCAFCDRAEPDDDAPRAWPGLVATYAPRLRSQPRSTSARGRSNARGTPPSPHSARRSVRCRAATSS